MVGRARSPGGGRRLGPWNARGAQRARTAGPVWGLLERRCHRLGPTCRARSSGVRADGLYPSGRWFKSSRAHHTIEPPFSPGAEAGVQAFSAFEARRGVQVRPGFGPPPGTPALGALQAASPSRCAGGGVRRRRRPSHEALLGSPAPRHRRGVAGHPRNARRRGGYVDQLIEATLARGSRDGDPG